MVEHKQLFARNDEVLMNSSHNSVSLCIFISIQAYKYIQRHYVIKRFA